jgi:hypothetical protein
MDVERIVIEEEREVFLPSLFAPEDDAAPRPHQPRGSPLAGIRRREVLGRLIHEYYAAA